jgi:hypothetical protein
MTTEHVCKYIKDVHKVYIKRNYISQLWKGELTGLSESISSSREYIDMLANTKIRNVQSKKFTETEILFIKNANYKDNSLTDICRLFQEKFGKSITRAYISKLKNV